MVHELLEGAALLGHVLDDRVHGQGQGDHRRANDLLHAKRHVDQGTVLGPLEAIVHHLGLDLGVERKQVLVRLPRLDLEVTEGPLVGLLLGEAREGRRLGRLELRVARRLELGRLLRAAAGGGGRGGRLLLVVVAKVKGVIILLGSSL